MRSMGTAIACPIAPADMPDAIFAHRGARSLGVLPMKRPRMCSYPIALFFQTFSHLNDIYKFDERYSDHVRTASSTRIALKQEFCMISKL